MNKLIIFLFFTTFLVNSCINIKSEYPNIQYYKLIQPDQKDLDVYKVDANLLVRNLDISASNWGSQFLINWDNKRLQKLFYNRWIEDFDLLAADFFVQRIQNSNVFTQGVSKTVGSALPDYILDININDINIENRTSSEEVNSVNIEITVSLSRRGTNLKNSDIILNKNYKERVVRENNNVDNIAPATSLGLANICDKVIEDVSNTIANQK